MSKKVREKSPQNLVCCDHKKNIKKLISAMNVMIYLFIKIILKKFVYLIYICCCVCSVLCFTCEEASVRYDINSCRKSIEKLKGYAPRDCLFSPSEENILQVCGQVGSGKKWVEITQSHQSLVGTRPKQSFNEAKNKLIICIEEAFRANGVDTNIPVIRKSNIGEILTSDLIVNLPPNDDPNRGIM
jgi:hypothetical protein